jgi:hypothetical protein
MHELVKLGVENGLPRRVGCNYYVKTLYIYIGTLETVQWEKRAKWPKSNPTSAGGHLYHDVLINTSIIFVPVQSEPASKVYSASFLGFPVKSGLDGRSHVPLREF